MRAARASSRRYGRHGLYADILVNNAAMMAAGFFQDQDPAMLGKLVDLNVRGTVDLTRRFLPGMIARGTGGVLNVASVEGFMPIPYQATYAATKAFVLSFSRALAYETMYTGVRVCTLAPGTVATGLHEKAGAEYSRYVRFLPTKTAEDVARIGYRNFKRGSKLTVTGWFNRLSILISRFVPNLMLVPFMGLLFRVLDAERQSANAPRASAERARQAAGRVRQGDAPRRALSRNLTFEFVVPARLLQSPGVAAFVLNSCPPQRRNGEGWWSRPGSNR